MCAKTDIYIGCSICEATIELTVELPLKEWNCSCIETTCNALCPKHKYIRKWLDSQCIGCSGWWGECGLWNAIHTRGYINGSELHKIRCGKCPFTTDGYPFAPKDAPKEVSNRFADEISDLIDIVKEK